LWAYQDQEDDFVLTTARDRIASVNVVEKVRHSEAVI
jgi:hypothetical protein